MTESFYSENKINPKIEIYEHVTTDLSATRAEKSMVRGNIPVFKKSYVDQYLLSVENYKWDY